MELICLTGNKSDYSNNHKLLQGISAILFMLLSSFIQIGLALTAVITQTAKLLPQRM